MRQVILFGLKVVLAAAAIMLSVAGAHYLADGSTDASSTTVSGKS